MAYTPKCMEKWQRAENYMGEDLSDYYIVYSKHRDSDLLEESNFDRIVEDFGDKDGVETASFRHWAVGWVESMLVRDDAPEDVLMQLDEVICGLRERYPVYDEEDWSQREYDDTIENIKFEGRVDEETAKKVFTWLWDNEQDEVESRDGRGGYPSEDAIKKALRDLGLAEEEDE